MTFMHDLMTVYHRERILAWLAEVEIMLPSMLVMVKIGDWPETLGTADSIFQTLEELVGGRWQKCVHSPIGDSPLGLPILERVKIDKFRLVHSLELKTDITHQCLSCKKQWWMPIMCVPSFMNKRAIFLPHHIPSSMGPPHTTELLMKCIVGTVSLSAHQYQPSSVPGSKGTRIIHKCTSTGYYKLIKSTQKH